MSATIEVSARKFELSHGRAPRGCGWWIFEAECAVGDRRLQHEGQGTYGEVLRAAKAKARDAFRGGGTIYIEVMP